MSFLNVLKQVSIAATKNHKKLSILLGSAIALTCASPANAATINSTVPGTSNPWFAGMPSTSTIYSDSAATQSPTQVQGLSLTPGSTISVTASGWGGLCETCNWGGADGLTGSPFPHSDFNGISGINAPAASLVGIFLGEQSPLALLAPNTLNFGQSSPNNPQSNSFISTDYLTISPELQQVFFIGDGRTSSGEQQQIFVPTSATRFYLGMIDVVGAYSNNGGNFDVQVTGLAANDDRTSVPEPSSIISLFALSFLGIGSLLKRQQQISHA
ncbi:MAG: PEP-CTERM sorting domain-containing protein [Phormidium sp.]